MIMLGCPIDNRILVVDEYMNGILNLDFPKEDIRLVFLVNNCDDGTDERMYEYMNEFMDEYAGFDVYIQKSHPKKVRNYAEYADFRNRWLDLRKDEKYIFSIDSDVVIPPKSLTKLLEHDKDIVSMLVDNSGDGRFYNIQNYNKNGVRKHIWGFNPGLIEIDITGAAYLIKSKVIDYGVKYGYHSGGEDVYFCKQAKDRGFGIYCDTTIQTLHLKEFNYV